MRNKLWILAVLLGVLMISAAGGLCLYNIRESNEAAAFADKAVEDIKAMIPDMTDESQLPTVAVPDDDLYAEYVEETTEIVEPQDITIGDAAYCGYLALPSLGIELPVMSGWSYSDLQRSPCRYSGSAQTNDMIIAAHNYYSHFGRIGDLVTGDDIVFTDTLGQKYCYKVSYMEIIDGSDVAQMFSGEAEDWDLRLFTCTLSGRSRVTIRADLDTDKDTSE